MKPPSVEITYRRGRPVAAYISWASSATAKCHATKEAAPGMIVDFARNGRPIGLELAVPRAATLAGVNRVLRSVGAPPLRPSDFSPLRVA